MKYKNRLIIPTIVSTSLLASTMVANAEEVDQNTQYSGQSTEVYSVNDETSATDIDVIESNEASEEEIIDEETAVDSEEEPVEDTETAEEAVESEQNTKDPAETETIEADIEETVAEEEIGTETDDQVAEAQNVETEEAFVEEEITESTEEVPVEDTDIEEEPSVSETNTETPAEEETTETDVEETIVEEDAQVAETQNIEEEAPVEETRLEETIAEEEISAETDVQVDEEENNETEETSLEEEVPVEDTEVTENPTVNEQNTEAPVEAETTETDVDENVAEESEETDTYKYDSESLQQELGSLSEKEQTVFLEENADDIEVDEQMLNTLSEALAENNEEINADEVYAATAGTFSTMSLSQAITDINDYIAENDFEVAPIQYDYMPGLPNYAYYSNHGWNPEDGVVGKPEGVVLHDVGNDNSTIHGEISYMTRNQENAFVHAFVDANNIIQVADTDYLAYGAGPVSNQLHMHVELVRHDNAHDFAKSINNYADYIANLLYKYKLPAVSAEETGEGTLWSHVAVSNHLGGTNSPDPYDYFARFGYKYNDVISLIGERYDDMYYKRRNPQISMPTEQGTTSLVAEVNEGNSGLYESVTDVRTKDASNLLGQTFYVARTATYNYDDYYLLQNEDGVALGWMNAADLSASEYVPEVEEEENIEEQTPEEPEVPIEPEEDGSDETGGEEQNEENTNTGVEEDSDENQNEEEPAKPQTPEEPAQVEDDTEVSEETNDSTEDSLDESVEDESDNQVEENIDEETDNSDQGSEEQEVDASDDEGSDENQNEEELENPRTPEEPVQAEDDTEVSEETDESTEDTSGEPEDYENQNEEEPINSVDDNNTDDSMDESVEDESDNQVEENINEKTEETDDSNPASEEQEANASGENMETVESEMNEDTSSLEDSATGVRVISASDELEGKSIVVTMMNPSGAIDAAHDLYDIHILDSDGSLYSLNNPVTVYLPANGYVSNVYYLGDIGETLEAVSYTTENGYVVFEVDGFSQYAVVYGNLNEDNTTITPVPNDKGAAGEGNAADHANEHPTVYSEKDVSSEGEAVVADSNDVTQNSSGEAEETEMLPNTGVAEQGTTIFAAILAALGLGFLVRRRKTTEK